MWVCNCCISPVQYSRALTTCCFRPPGLCGVLFSKIHMLPIETMRPLENFTNSELWLIQTSTFLQCPLPFFSPSPQSFSSRQPAFCTLSLPLFSLHMWRLISYLTTCIVTHFPWLGRDGQSSALASSVFLWIIHVSVTLVFCAFVIRFGLYCSMKQHIGVSALIFSIYHFNSNQTHFLIFIWIWLHIKSYLLKI